MPVFETFTQLTGYMKTVTMKEIVEEVEEVEEELINKRVEENLYDNVNSSDFYENTFGFRNSAETMKTPYGSGVANEGILVEGRLNPKDNYKSYYGGDRVSKDDIVNWVDQGHKGFYKGVPIDAKGKNIINDSFKDLTKGGKLKKSVTNKLKKLGYVISRQSSNS